MGARPIDGQAVSEGDDRKGNGRQAAGAAAARCSGSVSTLRASSGPLPTPAGLPAPARAQRKVVRRCLAATAASLPG